MRYIALKVPTFHYDDLPDMHAEATGFSLYRGVLVQWDQDRDERVLDFVDGLPAGVLEGLLIVQESKGMLALRWAHEVPADYAEGNMVDAAGDLWTIHDSRVVG